MIENIARILEGQSNNMLSLWPLIREYKPDMDESGNIFFTKGEAPYDCFVAHLDTVHKGKPDIMQVGEYILSRNSNGIGGDDKCGIIACLTLAKSLKNVKIVLFEGEEHGCIGSNAFDKSFFKDCKYVIGIDRKGSNDFITEISWTKLCSNEFYNEFKNLNPYYKEEKGLLTDVGTLKKSVNVCMANISCGYYSPHTEREYINLKHLNQTINALYRFANVHKNRIWYFESEKKVYGRTEGDDTRVCYVDEKTGKQYNYYGQEIKQKNIKKTQHEEIEEMFGEEFGCPGESNKWKQNLYKIKIK